ncbi:MAG: TonB-dependent receptor domain-containing protein, partial [Vicinamibacteria bacterium]
TGAHPTYSQTLNDRFRYSGRYYKNTASHTIKTGVDYTEQFGSSPGERYVKTINDLSSRPQGGAVILSAFYTSDASLRDRQIGLFIQDSWSIRGRATLDYGIRYDRESVVGRNNFSPRLGFSVDPVGEGRTKLFTNFGVLYSNLNSSFYTFDQTYNLFGLESNLDIPGSENPPTFLVVNPDENYDGELVPRSRTFRTIEGLKNPYALSYSVGVEQQLPMDTKLSVTYNHRDYRDNFKRISTRLNSIDVAQTQNNEGEATYDGVEFVVRKYLSRDFDVLAHYTLAKSEGDSTDTLSPLQQEFGYGPQDWDQRHTVVFISNMRLPYTVDATALFRYASGRPYSITNDQPDVFAAWVDPEGNPVNRNNERMAANWTIDLSLSRRFTTTAGTFTPSFEIINITNHLNIT